MSFAVLFSPLLVAALALPPLAALWLTRRDWRYARALAARIARG